MVHPPGECLPGVLRLCAPVLVVCRWSGRGGYAILAGHPTRSVRARSLRTSFTGCPADTSVLHLAQPERSVENAMQELAQVGVVDVAQTARVETERTFLRMQVEDRYGR